jgi:DNA repair protein RadC
MIKTDELQSLQQGHRTRLRKKFVDGHLTEYEILELLLTYAIPRCDVRVLSRQLYKKYGNISQLLSASMESLMGNKGIKENTAIFLKVIHKISEMNYKCHLDNAPIFYDVDKLVRYCLSMLGGKNIEEFHVLYLNSEFKLIEDELHSSGTNDWAAVYNREIVKKALILNAHSVVLVHNHPTPGKLFSSQDSEVTDELAKMLQSLSITLYDHLLVTGDKVFSARNLGILR